VQDHPKRFAKWRDTLRNRRSEISNRLFILSAVVTPILFLAPFLTKAYHIDDTLFIRVAEHIRTNPVDFYGFPVNWYGFEMPMYEVNQNPPLVSYFIAFASLFAGWGEFSIHLAFLLPALALSTGTYVLARSFCSTPWLAVLALVLTPVFMVSGTNIMTDTTMLALFVWAVFFWVKGVDENRNIFLFTAGFLAALSALTKYFGISLVPLLLVYTLFVRKKFDSRILFLLIPLVLLAGYQFLTQFMYGQGMLSNAMTYAAGSKQFGLEPLFHRIILGLTFTGGCLITISFFLPFLLQLKKGMTIFALFLPIMGLLAFGTESISAFHLPQEQGFLWGTWVQLSFMILSGIGIFVLAAGDLRENRDEKSWLLFLWFFGTFCFATFVNWTTNARTIYPMAPCMGIILARYVEKKTVDLNLHMAKIVSAPLIAGAVISLSVAWADFSLANCQRTAAGLFQSHLRGYPHTVWFQGHWGFQYYMEHHGMKPIDFQNTLLQQGEILIIPMNNTNIKIPKKSIFHYVQTLEVRPFPWLGTMQKPIGAGFYSDVWGPLPYGIANVPPEAYQIFLVGKFADVTEEIRVLRERTGL
jgi:4-amino-4-deoxy-L-arabinose transferase-like glycosyltransferase